MEKLRNALKYLEEKHKTVKNDYRKPNSPVYESCGMIANEIAEILIDSGEKPYIMHVYSPTLVIPLCFEGRKAWYSHVVCCCNGLVFDPILEKPIEIENYCKVVFGENHKMEIMKTQEETAKLINEQKQQPNELKKTLKAFSAIYLSS